MRRVDNQAVLIVDQLRRGFTFDTYHAAVGMVVIGIDRVTRPFSTVISSRSAPCRALQ